MFNQSMNKKGFIRRLIIEKMVYLQARGFILILWWLIRDVELRKTKKCSAHYLKHYDCHIKKDCHTRCEYRYIAGHA